MGKFVSTLVPVSKTYLLTLQCLSDKCGGIARIGQHQYNTTIGAMSHCPMCGGKAYQYTDNDKDYWEAMSDLYKLPPQIVEMMYSEWDRKEFNKFSDFVNFMKQSAGIG